MKTEALEKYLKSDELRPHFLVVGDDNYQEAKNYLTGKEFHFVRLSDFCKADDKVPSVDDLLDSLKDEKRNVAILGLGEYFAIRGKEEVQRGLRRFKDFSQHNSKMVLFLRGVYTEVGEMAATDLRLNETNRITLSSAECDISFNVVPANVRSDRDVLRGIKAILRQLEDGGQESGQGQFLVSTVVSLDKSLFTYQKIESNYDWIRLKYPQFSISRDAGKDEYWEQLNEELNDNTFAQIWSQHGFSSSANTFVPALDKFYKRIKKNDYLAWLFFIALKNNVAIIKNTYLQHVLENTKQFDKFISNMLNLISDIPHNDSRFKRFYEERKSLIEGCSEPEMEAFVLQNRKHAEESVYKLTDLTQAERQEVLRWISQNGLLSLSDLTWIYPDLALYLKRYVFDCGEQPLSIAGVKSQNISELLTEYFDDYKRQKVCNQCEPEFVQLVDSLAVNRSYFSLRTRNMVLDGIEKEDTFLCWLDALGVEYLSYIRELVTQQQGLAVSVYVARAELPTITSINKDFFDAWEGRKEKNEQLDDTKHNEKGEFDVHHNTLPVHPVHLVKELQIIREVILKASTVLARRDCTRFLIVSDHGASRLAVLHKKEEKYETDTKGKHSGRCCEIFPEYKNDLPFAIEENGHLVLADYGRFKGSRAADVEVHGGASLEEVVIPIIEITLKDHQTKVELEEDVLIYDTRKGTEIALFFDNPVEKVTVECVLRGVTKRYVATMKRDKQHYTVAIPDIKRKGKYSARVYSGENFIGEISFETQGKSAKLNDDFDF